MTFFLVFVCMNFFHYWRFMSHLALYLLLDLASRVKSLGMATTLLQSFYPPLRLRHATEHEVHEFVARQAQRMERRLSVGVHNAGKGRWVKTKWFFFGDSYIPILAI